VAALLANWIFVSLLLALSGIWMLYDNINEYCYAKRHMGKDEIITARTWITVSCADIAAGLVNLIIGMMVLFHSPYVGPVAQLGLSAVLYIRLVSQASRRFQRILIQ
jgi:hypothetical protein